MLVFDIETLQFAGKDYVWEFGALDNDGVEYSFIDWSIVKRAESWIRGNKSVRFFDIKQLAYAKSCKAQKLGTENFTKSIQSCLDGYRVISAYNIAFDVRHLTKLGVVFHRTTKQVCLWGSFVNAFIGHKYIKWCFDNELVSEAGNVQTSAEVAYKYLADDMEYIHEHTAVADCYSEMFLWDCIKKRKQKLERRGYFANVKKRLKQLGY